MIPPARDDGAACAGPRLTRRGALLGLASAFALGGTRLAVAQGAVGQGENRLIVVLLRGGMDGMGVVQPYGDPAFAGLRGPLALPEPGREGGTLDLGGRFGLHPALPGLHALYRANQAVVLHAVAGPHRSRSHFEAQDLLETGTPQRMASGWLNRALAGGGAGGRAAGGALAVGLDVPLLLKGPAPVQNYAPAGPSALNDDLMARIEGLLQRDPAFGPAVHRGREERRFNSMALGGEGPTGPVNRRQGFAVLAGAAGRLLAAPGGPRVAALEVGGWDTHIAQGTRLGLALRGLDEGIAALRTGLGDAAWARTAVLVVTEFGRTARVNGTQGTDHGTGGVAFVVGGAVAGGGRVRTDWPGLGQGRLFEDRDLQPTADLRGVAKGLLREHLRLPAGAVDAAFPDSGAVAALPGLVRA